MQTPGINADEDDYRKLLHDVVHMDTSVDPSMLDETSSIISVLQESHKISTTGGSSYTPSSQFVENEMFRFINSGLNPRIDVRHCIHPVSPEECDVYSKLTADPKCSIVVMPNHHITELGDAEVSWFLSIFS